MTTNKKPVRSRLLDLLIEETILPPLPNRDVTLDEDEIEAHNRCAKSLLLRAECVEASNVARFFEQSYIGGEGKAANFWSDLKILVPPYPCFFVEWERPNVPFAVRMGVLFLACAPADAEREARAIIGPRAHQTPLHIRKFIENERCRWILLAFDFIEFPKQADSISRLRGPYHAVVLSVSAEGDLLDFWMQHASTSISHEESVTVGGASLVAFTTLSMLNCSNIETTRQLVPANFQKARTSRGKRPLVSYHTIRVNLEKTPRAIEPTVLPEGKVRLHQKRGHMKDYRKGKGLFGRFKGVWYWGPMLVGSPSEGVVVSDYKVEGEKKDS